MSTKNSGKFNNQDRPIKYNFYDTIKSRYLFNEVEVKKGAWITWEIQRRNKGISSALGWPLYEIVFNRSGILRYVRSTVKTISIILREKPQLIGAQNPSIILALLVTILKRIFKFRVIIDAHNSGIFPAEGRSVLLMAFSMWLQKHADLTLVTNNRLRSVVEFNNGRAFVLPDRIPSIPKTKKEFPLDGRYNIAYICTFSNDEPYDEVIKSGNFVSEDVFIYITGKYDGKVQVNSLPNNVKLLGFVSEIEYWSLLDSVDIILDLTLREGCLVCGAYEGVALAKPLILSKTKTIMSYFSRGVIYVEPTASSIASGIQEALRKIPILSSEIKILNASLKRSWDNTFADLQYSINSL